MQRMVSVKAWADGIAQVLKAPLLVVAALVLTMAAVAPFGVALRSELRDALANQPPIDLGSSEIDADWWNEFLDHADGLAATFTPTVIGFAAPLDNLSAVLDGTRRPMILLLPAAIGVMAWALLWGAALRRFDARRGLSFRDAIAAALSNAPRFLIVSIIAAIAQVVLYVTLHPLLFSVIYPAIVTQTASEPAAFAIRVVLYLIFGIPLAFISLFADYSRVAQIVTSPASVGEMLRIGAGFVRRHVSTVAALFLLNGVLFAMVMAGYGVVDVFGGARVGGWRGVALGQAFIIGRLIVRLISGASEIALFKQLRS